MNCFPASKALFLRGLTLITVLLVCILGCHPSRVEEPKTNAEQVFVGLASYYGNEFTGRTTASGEKYDPTAFTASHRSLPLGTKVLVTNLDNNLSVTVTINDRGPERSDRITDLSYAAANELKMISSGVVKVRLEVINAQQ